MTIKEIAQLAGVSISTVSKVINNKDESIRPETRERVLRIVKEFNYVPYYSSVAPASFTRTFTMGILIRSAASVHSIKEIIRIAGTRGYTVLISEYSDLPEQELRAINTLCRHNVDGVLWEPLSEDSLRHREIFETNNIPYLFFHSDLADQAFRINFERLCFQATSELIKANHQNIACFLSESPHEEEFLLGYKKCLFINEIPYQDNLIFRRITPELIQAITSHDITGIVVTSEYDANRLYGELKALHYEIPYELSIITIRADFHSQTAYPNLSALLIPHAAFGRHVCEQLVALMENPEHTLIPFETESYLTNQATVAPPYSTKRQGIVVVGSINIDYYLKMEQLPHTGKSTLSSSSSIYPGGKALNQAVGTAKLGLHTTLIGQVGSDLDSNLIYKTLDFYGIDTNSVRRIPNAETGKAYVFVQRDGDSTFSSLSAVNGQIKPEYVCEFEDAFKDSSYCLLQTEIPLDAVMTACRLARKHGATIIMKPTASSELTPEVLSMVDILVANLDEIKILRPEGTLRKKADELLKLGIHTVIVTLGANGCYVRTNDSEESVPAPQFHSIDNTGAGDAFISALAAYLQDGVSLSKAVRIASIAAGYSITREGVPDSLVTRDTLETYLRRNAPELLS